MTDQELETLLKDAESDVVERKESLGGDARDTIRQAICAFANDLPDHRKPGVVFVGARDDGSCAGLPITDELLLTLANMKTDGNILPIPSITVESKRLAGCEVAVVTVQPSDAPPVQYKGRIWVRTGPRRDIASVQDERILNEKRRCRDLPFDLHPIQHAKLDDLNRRHRSYESTNAPIRITWFNDRIEIQNPGGPFGQVTKQNFGKPGVVDYRNPHLAEAMKVLG